jgi:hypothetical protein
MTGKGMTLTQRDRAVLLEANRFGVMTREQLTRLGLFASKTRANERLKKLVDAGLLVSRRQAGEGLGVRLVYLPGPRLPGSTEVRRRWTQASAFFLAHQLGLVDVRVAFERATTVSRWLADSDLAGLTLGMIPDGYLEYAAGGLTYAAFVEYDRGTETLGRVERKVRAYADLAFSGRFERLFGRRFFRLLLITDSPTRLAHLSDSAARVTDRVVRLSTLSEVSHHGPLASIWRRPGATVSEFLTSH